MVEKYCYQVTWSDDDDSFLGSVLEFPSLSAHGCSLANALQEIQKVVHIVLEDLRASGEAVPEPMSLRAYSGKFNLRIPPALHKRLAFESQQQQVSLNTLIRQKLGSSE